MEKLPEPTLLQRALLDSYPPTHMFAVISWGCAATSWLARTLNSHPDVLCLHAANLFWSRLGSTRHVDGAEYLRILGSLGYAHVAAGDVHGVSRELVPAIREEFGDAFSCVVVVREPMARLRSQLALFRRLEYTRSWTIDYVDRQLRRLPMLPDDSYLTKLFVHGVNMLNAVISERPLATIYRSEDLTGDSAVLVRFVNEISGGRIDASLEWAAGCQQRSGVNSHRGRESREEQSFEPWQQDVIRAVVKPESWEIYAGLGYPLPDFL